MARTHTDRPNRSLVAKLGSQVIAAFSWAVQEYNSDAIKTDRNTKTIRYGCNGKFGKKQKNSPVSLTTGLNCGADSAKTGPLFRGRD